MEVLLYVATLDEAAAARQLAATLDDRPGDQHVRVVERTDPAADGGDRSPDVTPLVTIDGVEVVVGRLPSDEELEWLLDNAASAVALAQGQAAERPERFSVPRRIHINMHVHDLSRTLPFYEVLLGAKPTKQREDYAKFELEDPPVNLALEQVRPDVTPKIDHLGIEVKSPDAVMAHRERYLAAGFKLTEELHVECCYSEQNKIWALDPHGLRWEVVNVVGDIESPEACPDDCICWTQFDEADRSVIPADAITIGEPATHVLQTYESAAQCGESSLCCAPGTLYTPEELAGLPADVQALSSGCGNPVALAAIQPGQTIVDIGSGTGTDAILAAKLTGPTGRVIGVEPSPSMRERATRAASDLGLHHITYVEGTAEHLPLDDASVDLVISNCVLAMSTQPAAVWSEIARVMRPGGTLVISDTIGSVSADTPEARARCEVGLTWPQYLDHLGGVGLTAISIQQAGTVQYRDGNQVQSATIAAHRPGDRPTVAIQLFHPGEPALAPELEHRLDGRSITAEITEHDPSDPAGGQLLAALHPSPEPDPNALHIFIDGRHIGTWTADPDDTLVHAVIAQATKRASGSQPVTAGNA